MELNYTFATEYDCEHFAKDVSSKEIKEVIIKEELETALKLFTFETDKALEVNLRKFGRILLNGFIENADIDMGDIGEAYEDLLTAEFEDEAREEWKDNQSDMDRIGMSERDFY